MEKKEEKSITRSKLEALYLELEKPMYNVVYRWLWDREESLDVVQEAFLRLWRMRERIDPEMVRPLVFRIALNIASNRRRTHRLWKWITLETIQERSVENPDAEERMAADQQIKKLSKIIEALPEKLRKVILLCDLGGMTYEEVGKTLGIPPGTVGSRRNKALRILKENFEIDIK